MSEFVYCTTCGHKSLEHSTFCSHCGKELTVNTPCQRIDSSDGETTDTPTVICTKCDLSFPEGTEFCNFCGNKLSAPSDDNKDNEEYCGIPMFPTIKGGEGTSTAGLLLSLFNVLFCLFIRFNFALAKMFDEDVFLGFTIPISILVSIFAILIAINSKAKNDKRVVYPTVIASVICFIISLIILVVDV